MQTNFSDVEQRVRRYWFKDGLGELAGGGMFLLIGLYFGGHELLPENSTIRALLDGGLAFLLIGGAFVTRWLVSVLKTRLTYPRTGYVEYYPSRKDTRPRRIWTAVIAVAVSMSLVLFGNFVGSFNWLPGFTGLIIGVVFMLTRARSDGLGRFYILAVISILLGLGLSFSGLSMRYSLSLFYGLLGLASMISGGVTLVRYLHDNPLPEDVQND